MACPFRAILFAAIPLVLCMLARPAFAADAPFCDDRGATALAAPPALDASGEAVARARACPAGGDYASFLATIGRARSRAAWSPHGVDAAVAPRTPDLAWSPLPVDRVRNPHGAPLRRSAFRSRLDRPPRV